MNAQNPGPSNNPNNQPKQNGLSWSSQNQNQNQNKPAATPAKAASAAPASTSATENGNTSKIVGWLAVGVVAGVLVAWAATSLIKGGAGGSVASSTDTVATSTAITSQTAGTTTSAATTTPGLGSSDSLSVASPQKAGTSVAIQKAVVSEPTWVVVYESRNGQPGNILGAALFFPNQPQGSVELLRGTMAGQTYFVTRQSDNGDRKFSKTDPLVLEGGQAVWASFTAN